MKLSRAGWIALLLAPGFLLHSLPLHSALTAAEPVEFNRDILPLLADRCFRCHGPDAVHREADLRLDQPQSATGSRDGGAAIVPGDPAASQLIARISTADAALRMPPADANITPISDEELGLLRRWIAAGATWGQHWSFRRPTRPAVPAVAAHPIDAFIRETASMLFHPTSTCRMGTDERAVVDGELKVNGVDGLRVVDASVMPYVIGGHTNAPTIMIAEKLADRIRGRAEAHQAAGPWTDRASMG